MLQFRSARLFGRLAIDDVGPIVLPKDSVKEHHASFFGLRFAVGMIWHPCIAILILKDFSVVTGAGPFVVTLYQNIMSVVEQ